MEDTHTHTHPYSHGNTQSLPGDPSAAPPELTGAPQAGLDLDVGVFLPHGARQLLVGGPEAAGFAAGGSEPKSCAPPRPAAPHPARSSPRSFVPSQRRRRRRRPSEPLRAPPEAAGPSPVLHHDVDPPLRTGIGTKTVTGLSLGPNGRRSVTAAATHGRPPAAASGCCHVTRNFRPRCTALSSAPLPLRHRPLLVGGTHSAGAAHCLLRSVGTRRDPWGHRETSRGYRETPLGTRRPSGSPTGPRGCAQNHRACTAPVGPPQTSLPWDPHGVTHSPQPRRTPTGPSRDPHGTPTGPSGCSVEGCPVGTPSEDSMTLRGPPAPHRDQLCLLWGSPSDPRGHPGPHGVPTSPMETPRAPSVHLQPCVPHISLRRPP